jgi:hypothetical protein
MKRSPLARKTPMRRVRVGKADVRRVMGDGRVVLDTSRSLGRALYRSLLYEMVSRQGWRCCLHGYCPSCPGSLRGYDPTFDHENGRGMGGGKRDDRIVLPNGQWQNGAAHNACNSWKGSRRIEYNAKPEGLK